MRSSRLGRTASHEGWRWRSMVRWFDGPTGGTRCFAVIRAWRWSVPSRADSASVPPGAAANHDARAERDRTGLELGGRIWGSRLIVGTGGFRSLEAMERALLASGAEIATVALRRVDPTAQGSVLDVVEQLGLFLLPNTAGCYTARDAV